MLHGNSYVKQNSKLLIHTTKSTKPKNSLISKEYKMNGVNRTEDQYFVRELEKE